MKDIEIVKRLGFDGIVTGILQSDGQIDLKRMDEIIKLAHPLSCVPSGIRSCEKPIRSHGNFN